ncbi:MAG: Trm112 family protein [Candidatus Heimdallarchaeota archaeon]|nr:Trm112 family protein [Candidatus Heimdallarchaeota archaeon]
MVSKDLLEILRCPNCVKEKEGDLIFFQEYWLLCEECGRKYPIVDDIPVMLLDEGEKWVNTKKSELPIPPPDLS